MKYLLTILFVICTQLAFAQTIPMELTTSELMKDIEQVRDEGKGTKMVFWFPQEYWDVCANSDPNFQKSVAELIKATFEDYTLIIAADMYETGEGNHDYQPEEEMKKNIKIVDAIGNEYLPLEDKDISSTALLFKEKLSPALANAIGEMGKHAYLFFFKTAPANTNSTLKNGSFRVILNKSSFKWVLPLACMLPPKYCPVDELKMHGDWLYCPYHGVKLGKE